MQCAFVVYYFFNIDIVYLNINSPIYIYLIQIPISILPYLNTP